MVRALTIAAVFFTMTPLLISLQWLLERLHLPGWGFIARNYYRLLCALLGIRVRVVGAPAQDRAVLYVSNHVSWTDIVVIGSIRPVAFVAKSEVAKWPLVGITAKIQRTVFVERARRHRTADSVAEIALRLAGGTSVVLFAEGTSSDGNRVLPFRSALLGAIQPGVPIQPLAICYTGVHGIPMGRRHRPLVAWYGDLDFMPHIRALIARGAAVDAVVTYAEPIAVGADADRKTVARQLEDTVRALTVATLSGKPLPAPSAAATNPAVTG
jgi:1-acyl-sn-glycerol-3-phosphate acyltransferase